MEAMNRRQFVKIGAVAGLSIFAFGALPGCGQEAVGTDAGQQGGKTMRTVTDMLGRDVEICVPEEITAYGCNAWAEVPFMSMLGVTDALLAGYDLDITENMKILYPGCDHYTERPFTSEGAANIEEALTLDLDFVFLRTNDAADERLKQMEDAGIKVLCCLPGGMDEIDEYLLFMGTVFGDAATKRAQELISYQEACLKDLNDAARTVTERPRVVILWGMGDGTYRLQGNDAEVIMVAKLAGADLCYDEPQYTEVSMEQVLAYDPDIFINFRDSVERADLEANEAFTSSRAYQAGQFYSVPYTLAGQAPSSFPFTDVCAYYLMSVIRGDAYEGPTVKEALKNNALNFFDYEPSEDELTAMENGEVIELTASHKKSA